MADLADKDSSQTVKITGSDASGVETNFVGADSSGNLKVILPTNQPAIPINGSDASGTSNSGNPIKIGGVYNAVAPVFLDGQRADVQVDVNGRLLTTNTGVSGSVDANQFYCVALSVNMATASIDNPLILVRNPVGSGKIVRVWRIQMGIAVTNTFATFRSFADPVVLTNGSSVTAISRNIGGGAGVAKALVTTLPTISSSGSQLASLVYGQNNNSIIFSDDFSVAIKPGHSLMLTGAPGTNGRISETTFIWTET